MYTVLLEEYVCRSGQRLVFLAPHYYVWVFLKSIRRFSQKIQITMEGQSNYKLSKNTPAQSCLK